MASDEVDLDGGWWTIPAARAKNGLSHRAPLSRQAVEILRARKNADDDSAFVFRTGT